MELTCNSCSENILIPDEKIPKDRLFNIACPQCKTKISVAPKTKSKPKAAAQNTSSSQKGEEEELDFIEEGVKLALVCDHDNAAAIIPKLVEINYKVRVAINPEDAINRIRFTVYDIIILNEKFECDNVKENNVLSYLQPLPMSVRRKIILLLIADRCRTFDSMEAFVRSVNLLVNKKDISNLTKIIKKFTQDHGRFYKIYNESLKKLGKD